MACWMIACTLPNFLAGEIIDMIEPKKRIKTPEDN